MTLTASNGRGADFKARLAHDLLSLLETPGSTSDLTLISAGGSFPVHCLILTARCKFFATLFASGFGDASARELRLPDADPAALALLLRFIYGGILEACDRELLMPAADLAEYLRLGDACEALQGRLVESTCADSIVADMLWADARGHFDTLEELAGQCVTKYAGLLGDGAAEDIAARAPKLLARLFNMLR